MTQRICVLGLPRSGSQHVTNLLSINIGATNLIEPFTKHPVKIKLLDQVADSKIVTYISSDYESSYDVQQTLSILKNGDPTQSLVLKLFPYNYVLEFFPEIIKTLKELNFKFVSLKRRNVEYHLLSYAVAIASDYWTETTTKVKPVGKVIVDSFKSLEWLYKEIQQFDNTVASCNVDANIIYYEDAEEDITKLLNKPTIVQNSDTLKQAPIDPWSQIENIDEVKAFFNTLFKN